mmetsp:Transcript_89510/g.130996  ORF Transcript_89510/g.130996 Transcript_89510/m.130996 type:complete len:86 (+) Transcript_89510:240-497(+)
MEMQNYYYALQADAENQEDNYFFWGALAPALTHQTGCDLLLPQTLSLEGQEAFLKAIKELEGTMVCVYNTFEHNLAVSISRDLDY